MSLTQDLLTSAYFLLPIGAAVGGLHLLGRKRRAAANEYDLWAPHADEPATANPGPAIVWHDQAAKDRHDQRYARDEAEQAAYRAANAAPSRRIRPAAALAEPVDLAAWETSAPVGEPVPPVAPDRPALRDVQWTPPYAELALAQVIRRYGDDAADIARRFLQEIGDEQRALAVTR
ncbi:hypothetical protein [Micromonospora sp. NPDC005324]|uniref:hypothetical protein n=1 Tax=Micromonospora sp. NPDC005324 TaxID=3157033 RepID=UPI0033AF6087